MEILQIFFDKTKGGYSANEYPPLAQELTENFRMGNGMTWYSYSKLKSLSVLNAFSIKRLSTA